MNQLSLPLDVLVVAPHPDDAEIGVGGTLVCCQRQKLRVGVVELTSGEPTPHGSPEIRAAETEAATSVLGLDWRHNLGLPNRSLEHTLEARRSLASIFRLTRPRLILAPYWEDSHPDHVVASSLVDAARFWSKLSRTDMPGEPYHPPRILYYFREDSFFDCAYLVYIAIYLQMNCPINCQHGCNSCSLQSHHLPPFNFHSTSKFQLSFFQLMIFLMISSIDAF